MEERALGRFGAVTGLLYVVLTVLSAFMYPQEPGSNSSAATTLTWVHDHRLALQTAMIIGLFAAGALLWFASHVRVVLRETAEPLAPMVFGSGLAVAVLSALAVMPVALLAFMDSQPAGIPDGTVVRMLADLNTVLFGASSVMTAVFLVALGLVMLSRKLAGPWLGWVSVVVAVLNAVAVWIAITFSSYHGKGWNVVGYGAFLGFAVIVLILSISMLRHPSSNLSATPAAAVL